ncbi:MAG: serine O-acetyltransferase EpsC, partial [Sphaerochaetaceae bacterium]
MKQCKDQQFDASSYVDAFYGTFDRIAGNANFHGLKPLPQMMTIGEISNEFLELMFPGRCGRDRAELSLQEILKNQMQKICSLLKSQIFL